MSEGRTTLAIALSLLMIATPLSSANISSWDGPDVVNSNGNPTIVSGFTLPGNSTVMDGWLHVTNNPMSSSGTSPIFWDEDDFESGYSIGAEINGNGDLVLEDDGTRSNISNFDVGEIEVSLSSLYTYSPGWRVVFEKADSSNLSGCGGGAGTYLSYGMDNDFNENFDSDELLETLYFCETFANDDQVISLTIADQGSGYIAGNLSASGGGGSGFSGTYTVSSGIESISITNGGSGYGTSSQVQINTNGDGTGAAASIGSVDGSGSILTISVDSAGSGYQSTDSINIGVADGNGASLSANLYSTGKIHSASVTDTGSNYTSAPTIVISDSGGSGGDITANMGDYYEYEVDVTTEPSGANCPLSGKKIEAGLDMNRNRNLDSSEISNTTYICNQQKLWQATTFMDLNGSTYGDEQTLGHGVVPSSSFEGIVSAGTLPGQPVPAGTSGYLLIPKSNVPRDIYINGYYLTFNHWYHLDSTSSGGGDGAWVEYRLKSSGDWGNWTYFEPQGGYPSTMSTDAPLPNGATSPVPVFASTSHSGWVENNFSLSGISGIGNSEEIEFRFQIWTHPNASSERPGWFLDNIRVANDGFNVGSWHHGCYTTTSNTCTYSANAMGSLERTIDLTGTNSTSKIQLNIEWDLEGGNYDNACVEISLNGNTWTDISSTTSSTASDCSLRTGAIPGNGYTADNGESYGDQSGDFRKVSLDIPSGFQGQSTVYFRVVVDTNGYTNYGGSYPSDSREGLTLSDLRVLDYSGNTLFVDEINSTASMTHSGLPDSQGNPSPDDWAFFTVLKGHQSLGFTFEDATANSPTVNDEEGWTRSNSGSCSTDRCKFTLNRVSPNSGPPLAASFPYLYGVGFSGNYEAGIDEARLISPAYEVPLNGTSFFTFDHWACSEASWDGGAVFIKRNNGNWQHFDPGWYSSTAYTSAGHNLAGMAIFSTDHCTGVASSGSWSSNSEMTTLRANLDSYKGDTVKFKFAFGSDAIWNLAGWFIDNAGVTIANYGATGHWLSPTVSMDSSRLFNHGFVDIEANVNEEGWIRGSIVESATGAEIPGFTNLSFPFSLAGLDSQQYPYVRLKVHMGSDDPEVSPSLRAIHIGAKRVLSADSGYNGWDYSTGVEVVDGLLNATAITGKISSDFVSSSRPIRSLTLGGNISSGVSATVFDHNGNSLGSITKGGNIEFSNAMFGYSVSVTLPTNGWIDVLRISPAFANPASNPSIDVLNDGSEEWAFPISDQNSQFGYGHFGWQSMLTHSGSYSRTASFVLDGTNSESTTIMIPSSSVVSSGMLAISPDSDGFESPVTISMAGSTISGGSGNSPFITSISPGQLSGISLLSTTHTDSSTGREWLEVPMLISSASAQSVSISSIGIEYLIFENVSGLGTPITEYHEEYTTDDPPPEELSIPISMTSDYGSVAIDGSVVYDYMFVNRDFSVPNTFYPDGQIFEVVTSHHHLYDNSDIAEIQLNGAGSDGNTISFEVQNSADGLWGSGPYSVSFSQPSGSGIAPLNAAMSYVEESQHPDGYTDIVVHWFFKVEWAWDDVDNIFWSARANDHNGETIWPSSARSGSSGVNAVENDIQIDSFEVRDESDRLISNIYDTMLYPFPILEGSNLNISGTVRFQDSQGVRPQSTDFSVALNLSGSIYPLQSGDGGTFSGVIPSPNGVEQMALSPLIISVGGPGSNGAEDSTGQFSGVEVVVDSNPPVAGPLEVQTPVGLQFVDGMVVDPTVPLSPFVTISEDEARGDSLTLRYWRTGVDDTNGDGIADENEYLSQQKDLSAGLTGQQQIQFTGIDVSELDNQLIHLYLEGSDWAGLTYQDGGTGGGPGATNSWASIVVAEDVLVEFAGIGLGTGSAGSSTFGLDRQTQDSIDFYLIPGMEHTFSVRLDEPNGFHTIDNITVFLCGYGSEQGVFSFSPYSSTLWSPGDSMLTPISATTELVTGSVTELRVSFELSWDFVFDEDDFDCKPRVLVEDGLDQIESPVLSALSWRLDNILSAIPETAEDLTPPLVEPEGPNLYLGQGDEFSIIGAVFHQGSGLRLSQTSSELTVNLAVQYGGGTYDSSSGVDSEGNFTVTMTLPDFPPLEPKMLLTASLLNTPGNSHSVENQDASITVDTASPTALFNLNDFPDSSLTVIETNSIDSVTVTVTIVEEIGMFDGPLEVSWEFTRDGQPIPGTEDSGELPWISSLEEDGKHIYQGQLDFTPVIDFEFQEGDKVSFWISSTDKAANPVIGLGGPDSPRTPSLRIVEFLGQYTREVITPSKSPYVGESISIVTYWENPGKLEGTILVGLYEQKSDGSWQPSISTLLNGPEEVYLPPGSSSVKANFEYQTWQAGQPVLVLVVGENVNGNWEGDFENTNYQNVEISGIEVGDATSVDQSGEATVWLIGALMLIISLMGVAFYVLRRGGEDFYYGEEEWEEDEG